jgi:hypothetical protein
VKRSIGGALVFILFAPFVARADTIVVHMDEPITLSGRLVCGDLDSAKKITDAFGALKEQSKEEVGKFQAILDASTCKVLPEDVDLSVSGPVAYQVAQADGGRITVIPAKSRQPGAAEVQYWFVKAFASEVVVDPEPLPKERWAAQDPNNESSSPVVWADSQASARILAVAECKKTSTTCSKGAASTKDMTNVFLSMCCSKPKLGCAIGAGSDTADAKSDADKIFANAGYSACKIMRVVSAGDGKPVR